MNHALKQELIEHDRFNLNRSCSSGRAGQEIVWGGMAGQARKDRFLAVLTELGGSAGNGRLRETLQWAEATYNGVKDDLVAEGVVTLGRGRGGSVSLAVNSHSIVTPFSRPIMTPLGAQDLAYPRSA